MPTHYPDIVMAGPEPLRELRKLGVIELRLRGRGVHAVPPHFLLDADIPRALRARTVSGADQFFAKIAFSRVIHPLRLRALKAFDEFFFNRARDVYPRHDFARMNDEEFGATLRLD